MGRGKAENWGGIGFSNTTHMDTIDPPWPPPYGQTIKWMDGWVADEYTSRDWLPHTQHGRLHRNTSLFLVPHTITCHTNTRTWTPYTPPGHRSHHETITCMDGWVADEYTSRDRFLHTQHGRLHRDTSLFLVPHTNTCHTHTRTPHTRHVHMGRSMGHTKDRGTKD
jgi:hypothetical protein